MNSIWVIRPTTLLLSALALLFLPVMHASAFENSTIRSPDAPDLIVITLNRVTVYSNAMHNGLILHAEENNVTMQIWDSGNFDDAQSREQLQRAIDLPAEDQPLAYAIWPINDESRSQMQELHAKHNVGLIQVNQLPSEAEWPYLVAYAGPNDALRAENAAIMVIEALEERFSDPDERYNVIGLGYPDTYAGYHLSIEAFADRLLQSNASSLNLDLTERLPLDWGAQPAYDVMLELLNRYALVSGPFSNPNAAKVDNQGRLVKPKPTKRKSSGVSPSSLHSSHAQSGYNSGVSGDSGSVHSSPPKRNVTFSDNPNGSKSLPPDALHTNSDSSCESNSRPQPGVQPPSPAISSTSKEEPSYDSASSTTKLELGPQFKLTSILRNNSSRFVSDITEDVHEGSTFEALVDDSFLPSSSNKERPLYVSSVVVEEEDGSVIDCDSGLPSNSNISLPPASPLYDDDD